MRKRVRRLLSGWWAKFQAAARRADRSQSRIVRHDPMKTLIQPLEEVLGNRDMPTTRDPDRAPKK